MGSELAGFDWPKRLSLRAGEVVTVRSKSEILATLDREGRLDGMPFMPEMLRHCGQTLRVSKRAERACDTVKTGRGRRVHDSVHLENVRCDGSAHGGCQALCLTWWKEAWLRRPEDPVPAAKPQMTEDDLLRTTRKRGYIGADVYSCQVTRLPEWSHAMRSWDPRLVVREIRGGNVTPGKALSVVWHAFTNVVRRRVLRVRPEPHIIGRCTVKTPSGGIPGLKAGDWVVIKSKEEIEATLNPQQRNRGLYFDIELLPFCGRKMRLLQKVDKIIDEKNGVMMALPNDCWIVEGAFCAGYQSRRRLFCTREIYPFWREIWFTRAAPPEELAGTARDAVVAGEGAHAGL